MHARAQRQDAKALIEEYVAQNLLPARGLAGAPFEVDIPRRGVRTVLYDLQIGDTERLALRCLETRGLLRRNLRASQLLHSRDIRVPEVVFVDDARSTKRRLGFYVLGERWIGGGHVDEQPDPASALESAAGELGRLHGIRRGRWGGLVFGRVSRFSRRLCGRSYQRLTQLSTYDPDFTKREAEQARDWLAKWSPVLDQYRPYNLIHGRLNPGNILVSEAGQAYLLDLGTLRYGLGMTELTRALHRLCTNPEEQKLFERAYFTAAPPDIEGWYRESRSFFEAEFHLSEACFASRQYARADREPRVMERLATRRDTNRERLRSVIRQAST